MIRDHWAIENSLNWVMDMTFRDDECRIRTENTPAIFTTLHHMAHNLVRDAPGKDSIKLRQQTAAGMTTISSASWLVNSFHPIPLLIAQTERVSAEIHASRFHRTA
jgi:hypothetical protein